MSVVQGLLHLVILLFYVALIIRLIFDFVQMFARDWQPRGLALVGAEAVYSVTDPPLRALRRLIPPLRLGGLQFDLAFLVLFLLCSILLSAI